MTNPAHSGKNTANLLFKLVISGGLIALVIHKTDPQGIVERLLTVDFTVVLGFAVLTAALVVLPAMRWKILIQLSGGMFRLARIYQLLMIGNFLAQALPSVGADGVRAWYLSREGMWLAAAANSVLLDRLTALATLLLLSVLSLPWLWQIVPPFVIWWLIAMVGMAVAGAAAVLGGMGDRLPAAWSRWRIVLLAQHLSGASRAMARSPRALFEVVALSMVVHLALSAIMYGLARAVDVPVGITDCILLFPLVILVATVPIGIAGWGVREGAMVVAFGFLGVKAADALLVSILYGIVAALSSLPGLPFWLAMGRNLDMKTEAHEK